MHIILINPPNPRIYEKYTHLGLQYICARLEQQGHRVQLFDCPVWGIGVPEILEYIRSTDVDLIGISLPFQEHLDMGLQLAVLLRECDYRGHICLGGHPATFLAKKILTEYPQIDTIILGEGEETLLRLVGILEKGGHVGQVSGIVYREEGVMKANPITKGIENLDALPFPQREFSIRKGAYLKDNVPILTSRGCYGACTFCSIKAFYQKNHTPNWRPRSVENVLEEIRFLKKNYGVMGLSVVDDNFIGPGEAGKDRAYRLADGLIRNNLVLPFKILTRSEDVDVQLFKFLQKAGLRRVFLGVESVVPRVLKTLGKQTTVEQNLQAIKILRDLNIDFDIGYILLDPFSTISEVFQSLQYLKNEKLIRFFHLAKLKIYTGTPLIVLLKNRKLLAGSEFYPDYFYLDDNIRSLGDKVEELGAMLEGLNLRALLLESQSYENGMNISSFKSELQNLLEQTVDYLIDVCQGFSDIEEEKRLYQFRDELENSLVTLNFISRF